MSIPLESITFPTRPYGQMPRQFLSLLNTPNRGFPDAWPENEDRDAFVRQAYMLLDFFSGDTHPWVLLRRELEHLIGMSAHLSDLVCGSGGDTQCTHEDLLVSEDNDTWGTALSLYCPTLASRLPRTLLEGLLEVAFDVHLGSVTLLLKQEFQRIRPYQAYQVLVDAKQQPAGSHFSFELLQTPWSPAYPGGHSYQAVLAFAFAVAQLQVMPVALSREEYGGLAQYAADIGDRRIMAGLHYPLDSVGGWLLAEAVASHTMRGSCLKRARAFMASCVTRSRVYAAIESETVAPYPKVLRLVHEKFPEIARPTERSAKGRSKQPRGQ